MDASEQFLTHLEPIFEGVLYTHQFMLFDCFCENDGRECVATYESPKQRLVLEQSDGGFYLLLASSTTPFPAPNTYIHHDGKTGWYALTLLVEYKGGKRLVTESYLQKLWRGEVDQYEVKADLFSDWAEQLLPLFEAGQEALWRDDFVRFLSQDTNKKKGSFWSNPFS